MKASLTLTCSLALLCLAVVSVTIAADVPQLINVQGKLTDAVGDPVADGPYSVLFSIYDVVTGGTDLWHETRTVTVSDGLFSISLGVSTTISPSLFDNTDLWLGIKVESDAEMTPRQRLTSVPYAMKSTGGAGDITEVIAGSGLTGGGTSGAVTLSVPTGGITSTHILNGSIDDQDLSNEPGIAANNNDINVTLNNENMVDIGTVTITIPTSGYIVVEGKCFVNFEDDVSNNSAAFQIDEISGGSWTPPYFSYAGWENGSNPSGGRNLYTIYAQRVYFKTAGTYVFRLEGQKVGPATGTTRASDPMLTAIYYSTSYGPVNTLASSPSDHPEATAVTVEDIDGGSQTMYKMDLRYYELRAKEARLKALEAERELMIAREKEIKER